MGVGKVVAWLNLAWNFARHVTVQLPARLLGRDTGAQRFRAAVFAEGYVPLTPDERALVPAAMQCINCGLCSLACPDLTAAPHSAWEETWTFVAGPSRSLDHAALVAAGISPCADCDECARVCPTGVPITQIAAMLRRLATTTAGVSS